MKLSRYKIRGLCPRQRPLSRTSGGRSRDRVVKKSEKGDLYTALDVGCVWLERALAGK